MRHGTWDMRHAKTSEVDVPALEILRSETIPSQEGTINHGTVAQQGESQPSLSLDVVQRGYTLRKGGSSVFLLLLRALTVGSGRCGYLPHSWIMKEMPFANYLRWGKYPSIGKRHDIRKRGLRLLSLT